jgi:phenylalanyl-tRNA synthetase alpha chain
VSTSFSKDSYNNISENIWDLTKRRVFDIPNHPIAILNQKIQEYFKRPAVGNLVIPGEKFIYRDDFNPLVKAENCFDKILVPKNHVSRSPKDTYYQNETTVL